MKKIISLFILIAFMLSCIMPPQGFAQTLTAIGLMSEPVTRIGLTQAFTPAYLKGMIIHQNDPFKFDFIVHRGDEKLTQAQKQAEYSKLIKYFLAALAVPDADQWVNLSPYEKDRIIPDTCGLTEMGRDLLAQDYLLKQISSSLTNPDTDLGKKFWEGVYSKAHEKFGTTEIPTDTFNKVWIIPDKALIYEKGNGVYVVEDHLKVMLESDYEALRRSAESRASARGEALEKSQESAAQELSKQVLREVIVPAIEKEVNTGKNFAPLRQVYSGMLLATWYKRTLKETILGKLYADKGKVKGVDQDPKTNQEIYNQYVAAFKKGAYNMIKEDVDRYSQEIIPRKYFSGGMTGFDKAQLTQADQAQATADYAQDGDNLDKVEEEMRTPDAVMTPENDLNRLQQAMRDKLAKERLPIVDIQRSLFQNEEKSVDREDLRSIKISHPDNGIGAPDVISTFTLNSSDGKLFINGPSGNGVELGEGEVSLEKIDGTLREVANVVVSLNGSKITIRNNSNKVVTATHRASVNPDIVRKLISILPEVSKKWEALKAISLDPSTLKGSYIGLLMSYDEEGNLYPFSKGPQVEGREVFKLQFGADFTVTPSSKNLPVNVMAAIAKFNELVKGDKAQAPSDAAQVYTPEEKEAHDFLLEMIGVLNADLNNMLESQHSRLGVQGQVKELFKDLLKEKMISELQKPGFKKFFVLSLVSLLDITPQTVRYKVGLWDRIKNLNFSKRMTRFMTRFDFELSINNKFPRAFLELEEQDDTAWDFLIKIVFSGFKNWIRSNQIKVEVPFVYSDYGKELFGKEKIAELMSRYVGENAKEIGEMWALYVKKNLVVTRTGLNGSIFVSVVGLASKSDFAMKGGIDFNSNNLDMQIKRDGNGVLLPVGQQNLDSIRIDGLVPVILKIRPATNLPLFSDAGASGPQAT